MRKLSLGAAALTLAALVLWWGCQDNLMSDVSIPDNAIAQLGDNGTKLLVAHPILFQRGKEKFEAIHPKMKGTVRMEAASVLGTDTDQTYLVVRGKDQQGNCASVAMPLVASEGFLFAAADVPSLSKNALAEETHTCTGDPCNSCSFHRGIGGAIIGCNCNQTGGGNYQCNHTVSGGS